MPPRLRVARGNSVAARIEDEAATRRGSHVVAAEVLATPAGLLTQASIAQNTNRLVVLLPGGFSCVRAYGAFARHLAQRCPGLGVLALGVPGLTRDAQLKIESGVKAGAELPSRVIPVEDHVALARAFVTEVAARNGGAKITLIGHSTGAYVAQRLLRDCSTAVDNAVLCAPVLADMAHGPLFKRLEKHSSPAKALVGSFGVVGLLSRLSEPRQMRVVSRVVPPELVPVVMPLLRPHFAWNALAHARNCLAAIREPDLALFAETNDRMRVMWALRDPWVASRTVDRVEELSPLGHFVTPKQASSNVDEALSRSVSHTCLLRDPEASAEVVAQLLAVEAPARRDGGGGDLAAAETESAASDEAADGPATTH